MDAITLDLLQHVQRVVVKIGSRLLISRETQALRELWLSSLVADIADWHRQGLEVIIVSSGAIGLGRQTLSLKNGVLTLPQKQAASAVGQIQLTHAYQHQLRIHGIIAAQLLLTLEDSENRRRYINARNTLMTLLEKKSIPVINENDTITTSEIRVGDNDRLAARVAVMASADMLVLLSDVDGLYTAHPVKGSAAEHVPIVHQITPDILAMATGPETDVGTGGMVTKLEAGLIANEAGCHMIICDGHDMSPLKRIQNGARHTLFKATSTPRVARKKWLASGLVTRGSVTVDAGAGQALDSGSSLLPAGIISVTGEFERGDAIDIHIAPQTRIGRGLSGYDATELRKIMGAQSRDIPRLIGYTGRAEVIHRDDMVMWTKSLQEKREKI